jgi:hypothetical protein
MRATRHWSVGIPILVLIGCNNQPARPVCDTPTSVVPPTSSSIRPSTASTELAVERYAIEGGTIRVRLIADQNEYMVGEPAFLSLVVDNQTNQALQVIDRGGDQPDGYSLTVRDERGDSVSTESDAESAGTRQSRKVIPVHGAWTRRLFLPNWARITRVGRYDIECRATLKLIAFGRWGPLDEEQTIDVPTVARGVVRVVATDHERMGKVISSLGTAMFAGGNDVREAELALSSIFDERAIPYLARAVASSDYSLRFTGVSALDKFSAEQALDALKVGMHTQGADLVPQSVSHGCDPVAGNIRHAAAIALSRSPHPDASRLLVSMYDDCTSAVRTTVVQAAAKMTSSESLSLLRMMTKDPDSVVRDEAIRCLGLREKDQGASRRYRFGCGRAPR